MFYLAKFFQILGLMVIGINFLMCFPSLMDPKILIAGILFFFCGWLVQRYLLRT